jgi:hypothetical protein
MPRLNLFTPNILRQQQNIPVTCCVTLLNNIERLPLILAASVINKVRDTSDTDN